MGNKPLKLSSERVWRTYLGGKKIDELHGKFHTHDSHFPEEWIMSITSARNVGREHIINEGMSKVLENEYLLKDLIDQAPNEMLGANQYNSFGNNTGVLIKIIDSAERLSIQVHPNKEKAKQHFNSQYGKTECWHILGGREIDGEPPCIYLGFKEGITPSYWREVFEKQHISEMLNCLHKFNVSEGDTYIIKGGVPHAIGSGCFLVEIQEPTDYTLRTERTTPSGFSIVDELCHQGIGFEKMFDCFDYNGMSRKETEQAYKIPKKQIALTENHKEYELVGYDDTNCFMMKTLEIGSIYTLDENDNFYGLYVASGNGIIKQGDEQFEINMGDQFFVPSMTDFTTKNLSKEPMILFQLFGPTKQK